MSMQSTANALLERGGTTYAAQAGITLTDQPSALYRLLVLAILLSSRIKSGIAVSAAQELARFDTPEKMRAASWQDRVDALDRGHYVRYDESTATALGEGAQMLIDRYHGDLRELHQQAGGDARTLRALLQEIPRLGPVGVSIFCREAQAVWPELRPYLDKKALSGAEKVGLPKDPDELAGLVGEENLAELAAALVRVTLEKGLADEVLTAA